MNGELLDAPRAGIALQDVKAVAHHTLRVVHNSGDARQAGRRLVGHLENIGIKVGEGIANIRFQIA